MIQFYQKHLWPLIPEIILLKNGMRPTDTGDLRDMEKGPSNIEILKATTHLKKAHVDRVADPPYSLLEVHTVPDSEPYSNLLCK